MARIDLALQPAPQFGGDLQCDAKGPVMDGGADDLSFVVLREDGDVLPVLDALRTLTQVEQTLAAAQSRLASDQVNLFLALGGGWQEPDDGGS